MKKVFPISAENAIELAQVRAVNKQWLRIFMGKIYARANGGHFYMPFDSSDLNDVQRSLLDRVLSVNGYNYTFAGEGQWSFVFWGIDLEDAIEFFMQDRLMDYEPQQPWIEYLNK